MHSEILSHNRQAILPKLGSLKSRFYLAGGTALALQIGHRESVDFDFFTPEAIDPNQLLQELNGIFPDSTRVTQMEKNTLSVLANGVALSFFTYSYPLIDELVETEYLRLATVLDIGCMKLATVTSRNISKDYVDLYFILQKYSLAELLDATVRKFPSLDRIVVLKGLTYFADIILTDITYTIPNPPDWDEVKKFLADKTGEYINQNTKIK